MKNLFGLFFLLIFSPTFLAGQTHSFNADSTIINCNKDIAGNVISDTCIRQLYFGKLPANCFVYCQYDGKKNDNGYELIIPPPPLNDYVHCGYEKDTLTLEDEIIERIEASQPTDFFKRDTIYEGQNYSVILPKDNCKKITLAYVEVTAGGEKRKLAANQDFVFDCDNRELTIINSELLKTKSIIELSWFYRECNN